MKGWKKEKPVFVDVQKWGVETVPNFKGHI